MNAPCLNTYISAVAEITSHPAVYILSQADLDKLLLFLLLLLLFLFLLSFRPVLYTMVLWYSNKKSFKKSWRFTRLEGSESKVKKKKMQ